ncbi:beta-lactamase family protein [Lentzea sp. NBC_00516]|uniref:serine hydrolase domain-containing protein n=1 Tax=Lentzea sp. NBC_00516 TaxID=2903582 RepID=UPI002E81B9B3|nr:serine hydrolase domain-containing protein [Lentzea sp. NBC_00516]WUD28474.1 beta-lactamase family protein [Lentzea sp. NBC_00516]
MNPSELLERLARKHDVPGAQLVIQQGGEVAEACHGVTKESAFPLGSLTKPFTAALVLTLADDGDLALDEELPKLPVTPRRLLTHTAGLAANVEQPEKISRRRWVARCRPDDLVHRPGELFSYSNAGYVLAGHLAEDVTGVNWWDAVESILLWPLGITPSFVTGPTVRKPVPGHSGARVIAEQALPELEAPAGGLALSAADLARFASQHNAAMRRDHLAGHPAGPYGLADGWGLGWAVYRAEGRTWFGHDGTGDGTSCHLRFEPDSGTVVALTTNAATGSALWQNLVDDLRADGIAVADHRPVPDGPEAFAAQAEELTGRYANGDALVDVTHHGGGRLGLSIDGGPGVTVTCHRDLTFTVPGSPATPGRFLPGRLLQLGGRTARPLPPPDGGTAQ